MANPQEKTTQENTFSNYYQAADSQARQYWGWHFKTAQEMFDQGIKFTQTWADFTQTQMQEGARLSQEMMKTGLQTAETMRKSFSPFFEKAQSHFTK